MLLRPGEGHPVRLHHRVDARLVDLDHEVDVEVGGQGGEHGVEVDHPAARLGPEPIGRLQLGVAAALGLRAAVQEVGEAVLDVQAADASAYRATNAPGSMPAQRRWPVSGPTPTTSGLRP